MTFLALPLSARNAQMITPYRNNTIGRIVAKDVNWGFDSILFYQTVRYITCFVCAPVADRDRMGAQKQAIHLQPWGIKGRQWSHFGWLLFYTIIFFSTTSNRMVMYLTKVCWFDSHHSKMSALIFLKQSSIRDSHRCECRKPYGCVLEKA